MHQQNMLQDQIRTGTYYAAILENTADFQGKVVMDVGAGSGILSLFAAQVLPASATCSCNLAPVLSIDHVDSQKCTFKLLVHWCSTMFGQL